MLKLITPATTWPVDVPDVRDRLNMGDDDDFDPQILSMIRAATEAVEKATGLALQPSTWEQHFDYWASSYTLSLAPVRSVTAFKYLDSNGTEQTLDAANYVWDRTASGAEINFNRTYSGAPTSLYDPLAFRPGIVRVRFTAGFNQPDQTTSESDLTMPERLKIIIIALVGHWQETVEAITTEQQYKVPNHFQMLIDQLKVYR